MRLILLLLPALALAQPSNLIEIIPDQARSAVGKLGFRVKQATHHAIWLKAPDTVSADKTFILPASYGTAGDCIKDNGGGGLYHDSCGSGTATLPFSDVSALVMNDSDHTKTARFDLGGISTGTLRVYALPDVSVTLVGAENAQVISGVKTFSSQVNINQKLFGGNAGLLLLGGTPASNWGVVSFSTYNTSSVDTIAASIVGQPISNTAGSESMDLIFLVSASGSVVERMRITHGGGVTIGSTLSVGTDLTVSGKLIAGSLGADLPPDTTYTRNLGNSSHYYSTLFVENIDGAPAGRTGNYMQTRQMKIGDLSGGGAFWDLLATANSGSSSLKIRDNGGDPAIEFVRVFSSASVNYAKVYEDLVPAQTGAYAKATMGETGNRWDVFINKLEVSGTNIQISESAGTITALSFSATSGTSDFAGNVFFHASTELRSGATLQARSGSTINFNSGSTATITTDWTPSADITYNLGSATNRWNAVYAASITAATQSGLTSWRFGGGAGAGKVWTSDASGFGGWTTISGGSGTVTSIATSGPISGGTITTSGTISCPTCFTTSGGSIFGSTSFSGGVTISSSNLTLSGVNLVTGGSTVQLGQSSAHINNIFTDYQTVYSGLTSPSGSYISINSSATIYSGGVAGATKTCTVLPTVVNGIVTSC